MARHRLVLADVLDGLRRASRDSRVRALVVKVGGRPIGLGIVQELRQAVREFAEAGKADGGLGRVVRRVLRRQRGLLPGHRVRHHLPAALRRPRADRHRRGADLPARRARQARRRLPGRQAARVQERRRAAHRARLLRPGQGGDRADDRLGHRAAGQRHRRAPRPGPRAGGRAHRPRPVPGQPGPGRRPGRHARLPRRGLRQHSPAGWRGRDPALPDPLPAQSGPGRAGPQAAGLAARPAWR